MRFSQVLHDLEALVGKDLQSIRKGSEIRIVALHRDERRMVVTPLSADRPASRPFTELESIWDELATAPAVHIESVLGGSGSCRNQPETILANLPYVEWLTIGGKKHISLVAKPSHPLGTLRQMDPVQAEQVRTHLLARDQTSAAAVVVVTDDPAAVTDVISRMTGRQVKAVQPGHYELEHHGLKIVVLAASEAESSVEPGTYLVFDAISGDDWSRPAEHRLTALSKAGLNLLLRPATAPG